MKILVANLGSTSFKYRLFDMAGGRQLARGGIERIGSAESRCMVEIGGRRHELTASVPDHAEAVNRSMAQLTDSESGCLADASEISAIAFKAVHGGRLSGVQRVTPDVLAAMEEFADVAPAHNPPYITAMRLLGEKLPEVPLVAVFETDFHRTIPVRNRCYAVPFDWAEDHLVRRWGFHGASHRYIAERTTELLGTKPRPVVAKQDGQSGATDGRGFSRIISCHLGGSSSLCAIRDGQSVATSMGFSPQSGLPQNNRAGDIDPFILPAMMKRTGKTLDELLEELSSRSGLLGLGGASGDLRDIEESAVAGNARAQLAWDVFTSAVRHYLGAYLVELGGADAIVFTGGIGENRASFRAAVCRNLEELGIVLDEKTNETAEGEAKISSPESRVQIWIIPTNEELIVARLAAKMLSEG